MWMIELIALLIEILQYYQKYSLLEEWITGNKLVINPDKTHLMVMGTKKISEVRKQVSTGWAIRY